MKKTISWFEPYRAMVEALSDLFHPFVEIAVHDARTGALVAIYHNFSRREVGQTTPFSEMGIPMDRFPERFPAYRKQNWDGREIKSTTVTVRNRKGKVEGLICINVDLSSFSQMERALQKLLSIPAGQENPIEMFGGNPPEAIDAILKEIMEEEGFSLDHLSRKEKKKIVRTLFRKGAFHYRHAVPYVASRLNIARATVYKYLQEKSSDDRMK